MKKIIIGAIALAMTTISIDVEPSVAQQKNKFFCATTTEGEYVTAAEDHGNNIPIIVWESNWPSESGWTPERRCQAVSERFQYHYTQNTLRYMRTGQIGNYPVICIAADKGGNCHQDSVILTLQPGDNAEETLKELAEIRTRTQTAPVSLSSANAYSYDNNGVLYVDVNAMINVIPAQPLSTEESQTNTNDLW